MGSRVLLGSENGAFPDGDGLEGKRWLGVEDDGSCCVLFVAGDSSVHFGRERLAPLSKEEVRSGA